MICLQIQRSAKGKRSFLMFGAQLLTTNGVDPQQCGFNISASLSDGHPNEKLTKFNIFRTKLTKTLFCYLACKLM